MTDDSPDVRPAPPAAPTRVQAPETRLQNQPGPAHDALRTRMQRPDGPAADPTATRVQAPGREADPSDTRTDPRFPEQLTDRYEQVRLLGFGSEGAVWEVRRHDANGPSRAVKVYWAGQPIDESLVAHLRSGAGFTRYCPEIFEQGHFEAPGGMRAWIEMEHLPETLTGLLAREAVGGRLPDALALALVEELANGISFWQTRIARNPLDYKPDNLLIRPVLGAAAPQIVLADFGGAAVFNASQVIGDAMTTFAYAPPERLWREKSSPWPWWSLGEIAYEMATGSPRYRSAAGGAKDDSSLNRDLVLGADLTPIHDARWKLLVGGLLTQDPADRWGSVQVASWLAGGSPPVAQAAPPAPAGPTHRPLRFGNVDYHDPALLAAALAAVPQRAESWLIGEGATRLESWLRNEVGDTEHDVAFLVRLARDPYTRALAVTAIAAAYAPQVPPRYRGRPIDADGLLEELQGDTDGAFARELLSSGALDLAATCVCGHDGCPAAGPCARLTLAAAMVPDAVAHARRAADRAGGGPLDAQEEGRAYQISMILALSPESARPLLRASEAGVGRGTRLRALSAARSGPTWWRALRRSAVESDVGRADGLGAWTSAIVLSPRMVLERAENPAPRLRGSGAARAPRSTRQNYTARVGEALLLFVATTLMGWSAATFRLIVLYHTDTEPLSVTGNPIGRQAGSNQFQDLGLFLCAGVFTVLLAHLLRHPGPLLFLPIAVAAVPGLAGYLPAFGGFELPGAVGTALVGLGGLWHGGVVAAAVGYVILAIVLLVRAIGISNRSGGMPTAAARSTEVGALTSLRRAHPAAGYWTAVLVLLVDCTALAWSVSVVCTQVVFGVAAPRAPLGPDQVGRFLVVLAVLAAAGAFAARMWAGLLAIPAAVAVYLAVAPRFSWAGVLGSAPLRGVFDFVDGQFRTTLPWVALAVALLVLVYGLPAAYRAAAKD